MEELKGIIVIAVIAAGLLYAGIWDRHHRE